VTYLLPGPEQDWNLESHQVAIRSSFFHPYYILWAGRKPLHFPKDQKGVISSQMRCILRSHQASRMSRLALSFAQLLCRFSAQIRSCTGWDALPLHVSVVQQYSSCSCSNAASQHTSAALTINENYDRGPSLSVQLRQS